MNYDKLSPKIDYLAAHWRNFIGNCTVLIPSVPDIPEHNFLWNTVTQMVVCLIPE